MLGRFRKKVTKQTIEMARGPLAVFQSIYGIPVGFWQDEFVLGFFGVMTRVLSEIISEGRLTQYDKGYILQETFSSLSNMNGVAIARHLSSLVHDNPQSEDFVRGADNGEIVTLIMLGKVSDTGRDIVEKIKKEMEECGMQKDIGTIQTILVKKLFINPLVERFHLEQFDVG